MKSDQRTRALFALPPSAYEPQRLPPGILTLVRVDAVTWHRVRLSDGSFGWAGTCPHCARKLHPDCRMLKPASVRCACGRWARLP